MLPIRMLIPFVAVLNFTQWASAGYTGVSLQLHSTVVTPTGPKSVYRLYANFTEGADQVVSWGGFEDVWIGSTHFHTAACTFSPPSSPFFQIFQGSPTAPSQELIDKEPLAEWDSFATIGVSIADQGVPYDQTSLSFGFPAFINGNQITLTDKFVYMVGGSPQSRADFAGDGDPQLRILLAQLTVPSDEYISGKVSLKVHSASGQYAFITDQSWLYAKGFGHCCLLTGECITSYFGPCLWFYNGYFYNCEPCEECENTCLADVAPHPGDGTVNVDDLLAVINSWGPCSPTSVCPADIAPYSTGNDVVDVDDLILVINSWGPCFDR